MHLILIIKGKKKKKKIIIMRVNQIYSNVHIFSWDNDVTPFKLPPGFDLMLADIDAGSHTPTLVGKVLAWKKSKPEEGKLQL